MAEETDLTLHHTLAAQASVGVLYDWNLDVGALVCIGRLDAWDLPEGVFGQHLWLNPILAHDRHAFDEALEATRRAGADFFCEYRRVLSNGRVIHVLDRGRLVIVDGKPTNLVGTAHDVTPYKLTEASLRTHHKALIDVLALLGAGHAVARLESGLDAARLLRVAGPGGDQADATGAVKAEVLRFLERIADGFVVVDRELRMTWLNGSAHAIMQRYGAKRSRDEMLSQRVEDVFHEVEFGLVHGQLRDALLRQKPSAFEARVAEFDLWLEFSLWPAPDGLTIHFRDIRERRKRELESAKVAKLEALGLLAGGIAHDFNNMLTSVMANVTLARVQADDVQRNARLQAAESAVLKARDLSLQLLTFARGGAPATVVVTLQPLIDDACAAVRQETQSAIENRVSPGAWCVAGDATQLRQMLYAVVLNGAQASPPGAAVAVVAENRDVGTSASVPVRPGRYVRLRIEDIGHGMAREALQHAFDPFFTTKAKAQGLGLTIAHSIALRHGGHIEIDSEPRRGTVVAIWLPAATVATGAACGDARDLSPVSSHTPFELQRRVLLMDDERDVREASALALRALGYEVTTVADGEAALLAWRGARNAGQPFAVVIMDLTVPGGMGGRDAVALMRAEDPDLLALVASGYSDDEVLAQPHEFGFRGAVRKPYGVTELRVALMALLGETAQ